MELYANLHTHSTHSDGQFTPQILAQTAKAEGYHALALTDHDTITGYHELAAECRELGMECIFGAEFTAPSSLLPRPGKSDGQFHITAYHFDPEYPEMKEYLAGMSIREADQTRQLFDRGIALGKLHDITWQDVLEYNQGITWLCNEHVFRAMMAKGLAVPEDHPEFFRELFGVHRSEIPPCYPFKTADEMIGLIHAAGGIAIVAHPHKQLHLIDALVDMGIDGMEVWHPDLTPEEQAEAYQIALEKNLYISGGSDHSGMCDNAYTPDSEYYIPPMTAGTTKHHFEEIRDRKLRR